MATNAMSRKKRGWYWMRARAFRMVEKEKEPESRSELLYRESASLDGAHCALAVEKREKERRGDAARASEACACLSREDGDTRMLRGPFTSNWQY